MMLRFVFLFIYRKKKEKMIIKRRNKINWKINKVQQECLMIDKVKKRKEEEEKE